jgi:hypothetical protein
MKVIFHHDFMKSTPPIRRLREGWSHGEALEKEYEFVEPGLLQRDRKSMEESHSIC